MLAIYLSPIYLIIHIYLTYRLIIWFKSIGKIFHYKIIQLLIILCYWIFVLSMAFGFFASKGHLERVFKLLGYYSLGITLYSVLFVLLALIIRFFIKRRRFVDLNKLQSRKNVFIAGLVTILLIASVCSYGIINAKNIQTTHYEVTVKKQVLKMKELNITMISDLHMGFNIDSKHIKQMVDKINKQNSDIVIIAGDIFDNEYDALDDDKKLISLLKSIKSKYGVYAVYGNHDIEEKILAGFTFDDGKKDEASEKMDEFLKKANIKILRDEYVLIDDSFYIYGRPDYSKPGKGITVRKTPNEIVKELDKEKPIIVVDHQPKELDELSKAGVDIDLSGHTHDGQCFPANIIVSMMWENSYGYLRKGNMHNIVSSGVGIFGPFMRVGTKAEICQIKVNFK